MRIVITTVELPYRAVTGILFLCPPSRVGELFSLTQTVSGSRFEVSVIPASVIGKTCRSSPPCSAQGNFRRRLLPGQPFDLFQQSKTPSISALSTAE
jgi:hypothetical protein